MDTYSYCLTEEEYYDYAKNIVIRKGRLRFSQARFISIVPVVCVILIVGFRWFTLWKLLCALLVSAVWTVFACWLFHRSIRNKTESYCQQKGKPELQEICLQIEDRGITINHHPVIPNQYLLLKKMIALYFTDGSEVVVPSRIFENNQEQIRQFLKKIIKIIYINGNHGERI